MNRSSGSINLLLVLALATDLLTPFLIWKGVLPSFTRWVSHAALATMMVGAYARMLVFDRVPGVVWLIVGISAIGIGVALFEGQGVIATAWGWWIMFQYPLVGLYAYLQPHWPNRFPQRLRTFCTAILGMQVVVQVGQYLAGELPGDNLAGTFGWHGTGNLVVFISLLLCLALGQWLAHGQWKTLLWVLAMGSVSSALGEMKLFPFAVLALGIVAMVIFAFRRGQLGKLVQYAVLMGAVVWIYFGFYDAVVVPARGTKSLKAYLELQTLDKYLGGAEQGLGSGRYGGRYSGRYDIGRNYALTYGWKTIRRDTTTFLFGLGLGARGESRTLGTAGVGLLRGHLGLTTGTSLLVMLQELGLVGMVVLGGFILWIAMVLLKGIKRYPQSDATELRYALLLFSLLWPLYLWYSTAWIMRVPMLLYWAALGYVLSEPQRHHLDAQQSRVA
jgi:hypothetical protein